MNAEVNNLLDMTLDDLADLPEFKPFPAGAHKVYITLEKKVVNKKEAIEAKLKAIETLELSEPEGEDKPLEAGAESGVLYMMDNEFGQGNFKKIAVVLARALQVSSVGDLITACKNVEVLVVTKLRKNKDTGQVYTDIKELQVL